SKEFREVFDIAVRLYPESDIAIMNSAAADIEGKNLDAAIDRLNKIERNPKAWNNLGVAYILKGNTEKALDYFAKAADSGSIDGKKNLETLQKAINIK
ncbi:tetratricopeptide repeat protein, partial [Dysgonomonas sp. UBA7698]